MKNGCSDDWTEWRAWRSLKSARFARSARRRLDMSEPLLYVVKGCNERCGSSRRRHREQRIELGECTAEEATLSQACYTLQLTEGLLDQLTFALREAVSVVSYRR